MCWYTRNWRSIGQKQTRSVHDPKFKQPYHFHLKKTLAHSHTSVLGRSVFRAAQLRTYVRSTLGKYQVYGEAVAYCG